MEGIAADGVARILVVIGGAQYAGQQIDVSIFDENGKPAPAADPSQPSLYGALSSVNGPERQPTVQVAAQQVNGTLLAFAEYYAPLDFSRGGSDDTAQKRQVNIQSSASDGSFTGDMTPLTIWRPPVVLVHGLWGEMSDWATFTPLYDLTDSALVFMRPAAYSYLVAATASKPNYKPDVLMNARAHALGFYFNAPVVSSQIKEYVRQFRTRPGNPTAAAQADVIAHSMGGLVTRAVLGLPITQEPIHLAKTAYIS